MQSESGLARLHVLVQDCLPHGARAWWGHHVQAFMFPCGNHVQPYHIPVWSPQLDLLCASVWPPCKCYG
jgi:hypothetical protein